MRNLDEGDANVNLWEVQSVYFYSQVVPSSSSQSVLEQKRSKYQNGSNLNYAMLLVKGICSSGCGSFGRAVAFDTRGPQFEYNHWQNL